MKKSGPKRILLVSPFPPAMGGISVSVDRLRSNLIADGWAVDCYNVQPPLRHAMRIPGLLFNTLWLPFYILFAKRYDIVHLHISSYWRRAYMWLTRPLFKNTKIVTTFHGDVKTDCSRPFSSTVFRNSDAIIVVRPGDKKKMPHSVIDRTTEIPAFIMPNDITGLTLPSEIETFVNEAQQQQIPLLVLNGNIITDGLYPDLYGFNDMVEIITKLQSEHKKFQALLIVNNMTLSGAEQQFAAKIQQRLAGMDNVKLVISNRFSLLPIFAKPNVIYVRPTKTDGDSLSVREALALGAKTIASDVAKRPAGTIVYDFAQGADALYGAVANALINDGINAVQSHTKGFYPDILKVYDNLLSGKKI